MTTRDMEGRFAPAPRAPWHLHTSDWDRSDRPGWDCDDCRETVVAIAPASGYSGLVTILQAASLLGLDPSTIRWQIKKGKIQAKKVGRDWQVTRREVERYRVEHLRE